jgi:hypothetical protein
MKNAPADIEGEPLQSLRIMPFFFHGQLDQAPRALIPNGTN